MSDSPLHPLTAELLEWYRRHARDLPWRRRPEPYATWLSEVILQQTRVEQGTAYWHRFMEVFPTVQDLAGAHADTVMAQWKGLGYYSRARNLQRAAQHIVTEFNGRLPVLAEEWRALPGIGPYTAAAIASICHGEPIPVVDGNVQRVLSRLFDIADPVDRKPGRAAITLASEALLDREDPGTSNQAWMEIGALVCTPRAPRCSDCPLRQGCMSHRRGTVLDRPVKQPKRKALPVEVDFSVPIRHAPGKGWQWWVERRPETGIWAQLESFPCTIRPMAEPSLTSRDRSMDFGPVEHILTHRHMTAWFSSMDPGAALSVAEGRWVDVLDGEANWPRLIEKVLPELRAWIVKN